VSFRTCGGGGYGPPEARDPQLVLRDVRNGKVRPMRAQEVYKVAINSALWTIDAEETARLRSEG
jgi:N-methylhydantoinase B